MKRLIITTGFMAAMATVFMLSACGSGGGSKPRADGPFGEFTVLAYEKEAKIDDIEVKADNSSDLGEMIKLGKDKTKVEEEYNEKMEPLVEQLKGKTVKTEVGDNLPVKITKNFTVTGVYPNNNRVTLRAEFEFTKPTPYRKDGAAVQGQNITAVAYNTAGEAFDVFGCLSYKDAFKQVYGPGDGVMLDFLATIRPYTAMNYGNLAKIVLVDRNKETAVKAKEANTAAMKTYKKDKRNR